MNMVGVSGNDPLYLGLQPNANPSQLHSDNDSFKITFLCLLLQSITIAVFNNIYYLTVYLPFVGNLHLHFTLFNLLA